MKLTKQSKTKLDLIRIEGLCKLILSKYDEDDIISKISYEEYRYGLKLGFSIFFLRNKNI